MVIRIEADFIYICIFKSCIWNDLLFINCLWTVKTKAVLRFFSDGHTHPLSDPRRKSNEDETQSG